MDALGTWINKLGTTVVSAAGVAVSATGVMVTILGILVAMVGWLYGARRSRVLSRTQHTFNALLNASFNPIYHENMAKIRPSIGAGWVPPEFFTSSRPHHTYSKSDRELIASLRFVLNYYEILAASVRSGEIAEELLRDTERSGIVRLYEVTFYSIRNLRDERQRSTTYEHLDWLHERWKRQEPGRIQKFFEWMRGRPYRRTAGQIHHRRIFTLILLESVLLAIILVVSVLRPTAW